MTTYEAPSTGDRGIWDLWLSGVHQGAIVAADDAGVFSALAADPATIEELAQRLNFDVRATGILLRLLGALGLLVQRDGVFHLTAASMHSHSLPAAIGAARNYDFTGVKKILDVGGGSGCFMIAMAQAHPELSATIMELGSMCEAAAPYIAASGVGARVDTKAVNMFREPWPQGYDVIFFSNIWHDWNFQTCAWLAERAYEALPSGGRIMLHEMLLDDGGAGPAAAAAFSMVMLLATQGQQFTFAEVRDILEKAGFEDIETLQTAGYYSITTGYKR